MINPGASLLKNAINLGALTGMVLAVLQMIFLVSGFGENSGLQWVLYIILIVSISWGARMYRDRVNEGYLSYGESLGFGVVLSLGAALIYGFAFYLYMKYLDPTYTQVILEKMELSLYESEMQEDQIKTVMDLYKTFFGPGLFAFSMVFSYGLMGFFVSLIISFFVKNDKPMFEE